MSLLPKSRDDFGKKEYWNTFFSKRGSKAFEWYGEYPELASHLSKYIKHKDKILISGCGNSSLGFDLYDTGYQNIENIDISHVVVKQMAAKSAKKCVNMKFRQMDVTNMEYEDGSFSVILDKGTLDALMPNSDPEVLTKIDKYFSEITRILQICGRFICISLLQEHILKALLSYFSQSSFMFRVARCFEVERNAQENGENVMPTFMVICTKVKMLTSPILEINLVDNDKMVRAKTTEEVQRSISDVQKAAIACMHLKNNSVVNEDVCLELFAPEENTPRYQIHVVDIGKHKNNSEYAMFVVPHGREREWLFSTKSGRKNLLESCKYNRLAIVTMCTGQHYDSFQSVQNELSHIAIQLAPKGYTGKILFLSLGTEIGKRTLRLRGTSEISGTYIVEDIENADGERYRRLIFTATQSVIQSEAKLKTIKNKSGKTKEIVDNNYLMCNHHMYMSVSTLTACLHSKTSDVLVIGVGGGSLCTFLHSLLPNSNIVGVDIDEDVVNIASTWFGLTQNERLKVVIKDGVEFLESAQETGTKYDAILFDVDSKDTSIGMSCPPENFLSEHLLQTVEKCLKPNGTFVLNVVLRDQSLRPKIFDSLKKVFSTIISYKLDEDLNEVVTCVSNRLENSRVKQLFKKAENEINNHFAKHKQKTSVYHVENLVIDYK